MNKYLIRSTVPAWFDYVGSIHGWFFILYAFFTVKLGIESRWNVKKTLTTVLAGTVPFCSFVVEHKVVKELKLEAAKERDIVHSAHT